MSRTHSMLLNLLAGLALLALPSLALAQVVHYYHLDAVGNVRVITDQDRQVVERHDYLPTGEECVTGPCASNPGVGAGQPRKFTSKERDAETGLDYFGARYYGARIARFSTVDPAYVVRENLVDPQRWNKYAYARNNPLKFTDPDGRLIDVIADAGFVAYDLIDIGVTRFTGGEVSGTQRAALAADIAAAAIPFATGGGAALRAAAKAEAAAQLAKNRRIGAAFEDLVVAQKSAEQTGVVRRLTVRTDKGVRTQLDAAGRDAAGNVRLTEAKSSETARLTRPQRKGFPEIAETGGTIAGKGKPGFPGGSRVPPTEVEICRPCRKP